MTFSCVLQAFRKDIGDIDKYLISMSNSLIYQYVNEYIDLLMEVI